MASVTALTESRTVFVPRSRAWAILTDWVAAPGWLPNVTLMEAQGPLAVGQSIDFQAGGHDRQFQVTGLEDGQGITLTLGQGDARVDYQYVLDDDGDDTRLSLTATVVVADALDDEAQAMAEDVQAGAAGVLDAFKRFAEIAP